MEAGDIIQTIVAVILALTVLIVYYQLRNAVKSSLSSAYQAIISDLHGLTTTMVADPALFKLLDTTPSGEDHRIRQGLVVLRLLDLYLSLWLLHRKGGIDDQTWQGWCKSMDDTFKKPGFVRWWTWLEENQGYHPRKFRDYVNERRMYLASLAQH